MSTGGNSFVIASEDETVIQNPMCNINAAGLKRLPLQRVKIDIDLVLLGVNKPLVKAGDSTSEFPFSEVPQKLYYIR